MKWTLNSGPDAPSFSALLFDLDGVLTPTTDIHMRAWSQMFNDYLTSIGNDRPYTDEDYFAYVDGKPRYEGVASFLASRGIELPAGAPTDGPDQETVAGLGNRKNEYFSAVLKRDGISAYPGSAAFIKQLRAKGVPMAVVSSSRNAEDVLAAAGIRDFFEFVVDGNVARDEGLAGKPSPETYSYAAERLGVENADAVVLEDAISGVQAGSAGEFGLVVGVDRGAGREVLKTAGADIVVSDLKELLA